MLNNKTQKYLFLMLIYSLSIYHKYIPAKWLKSSKGIVLSHILRLYTFLLNVYTLFLEYIYKYMISKDNIYIIIHIYIYGLSPHVFKNLSYFPNYNRSALFALIACVYAKQNFLSWFMMLVSSRDINANFIFVTFLDNLLWGFVSCWHTMFRLSFSLFKACLMLLSLKLVIIYPAHSAARFNPCPSCFLMLNTCNVLLLFIGLSSLSLVGKIIFLDLMERII